MEFEQLLHELKVNEQELLNRFSGNKNLLERFICKFSQEKTYGELQSAFEKDDKKRVTMAIHTLKGIAGNLGFIDLYHSCDIMLNDLRSTQENIAENFTAVSTEYQRLISLIQKYSSNIDK